VAIKKKLTAFQPQPKPQR